MPKTKTILGVDASRYPLNDKVTGVELYTREVIDGIVQHSSELGYDEVRFFTRHFLQNLEGENISQTVIKRKHLWTRVGLTREIKINPVTALFVPSHTLPDNCPEHTFLTVHGIEALLIPRAYSKMQRMYQKWAIQKGVQCAEKMFCVSQSVADDVARLFNCPKEKLAVIHNGFDARCIRGGRKNGNAELILESYGIREDDKYILNVGRIEVRKNQIRLIEAFAKLKKDFPEYKLVLAGPESYRGKSVLKMITDLGLEDEVMLLGHVPHCDIKHLMEHAQVFAYPSLAEGFGIPVLEAFAVGVPVLTSNTTALPEVAGKGAVMVNPLKVEEIYQGLKSLLDSPKLAQELRAEGEKQLKKFSWKKCVDETLAGITRK